MDKFNNQFATQKLRQEMSVTGTGASFTPGTGEQTAPRATKKVVRKKVKKEEKDVEPKLAAGNAKVYAKEKWGWKDAPSVPNRPSKGGFIYKQLFEELSNFVKENKLNIKNIGDFNSYVSKVREAIRQMRDENSEELYKALESLRFQTDLMSAVNILDDLKVKIENHPKVDRITKIDALKAIEGIRSQYEPEEQDDNEDSYDWFTDKYDDEPVSDYGKYRQDPDYYEKDYQEKGTSDYFQRRGLDEDDVNDYWTEPTRIVKIKKGNHTGKTGEIVGAGKNKEGKLEFDVAVGPQKTIITYNEDDVKIIKELNESYSRFKNETKTRGKADQFHQAIREVRKKVQEINRLFEYVSRLKLELSEGEGGLKYKVHTEKALAKIKEMVAELNQNIKKFK